MGQNVQLQGRSPSQGFRFRKRGVWSRIGSAPKAELRFCNQPKKILAAHTEKAALPNWNVDVTGMIACPLPTPRDELFSPFSGSESIAQT